MDSSGSLARRDQRRRAVRFERGAAMGVHDGEALRKAVVEANRSRGDLYLQMLRTLERRHGRAEAIATMKEAIRAWGCGLAAGLVDLAPGDFDGLKQRFALPPD